MNLSNAKGSMSTASSSSTRKAGAVDQFPSGLRVLVVDDDPTCLMILEQMLRTCLYQVTKCNRAEVALSLLRENKNGFDIVISDVHMPDMDGFKLLEHIVLEMDLPVIMMSADAGKNVVMKGVTHGACDYLTKPVRIEALKDIWQHVVRKRKNERKDLAIKKHVVFSNLDRVSRDLHAVKKEDPAAANSISLATNFGTWEKGESIGAGGYGTVYVARNRAIRDLCAVKEIRNMHKLEHVESIKKEIKILSQLKHPNIVKYYDYEVVGHCISLYMEYIQPGSLKQYISKRGVLHEPLIRNFTAQILSGLVYLHGRRVVHRDIKPDNLLVDSNNIIKLVDFGLSKHLAESVGKHSELGTPYYSAPEVLQKIEYKSSREASAADIWSLGCVIIEMFSGKHPWPGFEPVQAFYKVCFEEPHPPIPEELCSEGKDFLKLCFTRTPTQRPSSAALLHHPFVKAQTC